MHALVKELGMPSHKRALVAIVLVNFVSIAGFGFLFPVFAFYGDQIGATGSQIAWAIAAFSLGQLISGPIWGRLSDSLGRRPVLISSLLIGAAVYALHAFAETPAALIAVRFAGGLASGSFAVAFAVASDISTPATRTRTMGLVSAGFSIGFVFGPAIGGFTAGPEPGPEAFGRVCFVGAALMFLAAVVTFALLPETRRKADETGAPLGKTSLAGLVRTPAFLAPMIIGLVAMSAMAMMESVFTLFADAVLGLSPLGIGLMFSAMGVTGAVMQAGAAGYVAQRFGERRMLIGSLAALLSGMILMGSAQTIPVALLAAVTTAIGFSLLNPAIAGLASFAAPAGAQGAALGLVQGSASLGRVLGPAGAGPIYDVQGPSAAFFWGAAILAATMAGVVLWRPDAADAYEGAPASAANSTSG